MKKTSGFTLAELLVVVAIIAVLISIAIPVFVSQLEAARLSVDVANVRSAFSEQISDALISGADTGGKFRISKSSLSSGSVLVNGSSIEFADGAGITLSRNGAGPQVILVDNDVIFVD